MKKNLILVSYYFAPLGRADGVNRTYLTKYLANMNWDIEVITGDRYRSFILNFQKDPNLLDELPSTVKIHRFPSDHGWLRYDLKEFLRINNNLRYAWIKFAMDGYKPNFQKGIVMAVIPPIDNGVLAYKISQKYDLNLCLYFVDLVTNIEKSIIERSNLVICVSKEIQHALEAKFCYKKTVVIEHGFPSLLKPIPSKEIKKPLKLVYAGSFNFEHDPAMVAKAIYGLRMAKEITQNDLTVDFYGPEGYYYRFFLKKFLDGKLLNYKGYLAYKSLIERLPRYDMGITVNRGRKNFPSKAYQYFGAGIPILAATQDASMIQLVNKNNLGIITEDNVASLCNQIKKLLAQIDLIPLWKKNVLKIQKQFLLENRIEIMDKKLSNLL